MYIVSYNEIIVLIPPLQSPWSSVTQGPFYWSEINTMNPPFLEDLPPCPDMPCPMSTQLLLEPLVLELPVEPLIPIPCNLYQCQYLSMEQFVKHMIQNPVSSPLDDQDSPMSNALPLKPEPTTYYLPDSPESKMYTLSPEESPTEPWQRWLDQRVQSPENTPCHPTVPHLHL